jgi:hypothetical protein
MTHVSLIYIKLVALWSTLHAWLTYSSDLNACSKCESLTYRGGSNRDLCNFNWHHSLQSRAGERFVTAKSSMSCSPAQLQAPAVRKTHFSASGDPCCFYFRLHASSHFFAVYTAFRSSFFLRNSVSSVQALDSVTSLGRMCFSYLQPGCWSCQVGRRICFICITWHSL